jgi:SAM-dependent methyltransferase
MLPYECMSDIHSAASEGFSREALSYARGRPGYPQELLNWLRCKLRVDADHTVVDLGAGTGKFTQLLRETGARVIAVEPIEAMRAQLQRSLPDVETIPGTAQAMPLKDGIANAVVCAQAFHWFATREALLEIQRVLTPAGLLGLIWNVRDESVDWVAAITAIITPYEGDAPRFHSGAWRRVFAGGLFSELEETRCDYQHVGSAQEVIVDRFLSVSFIAALPAAEKARVEQQLKTLIATHPQLKDRPSIAFPYQTRAYRCTSLSRRDAPA